MKNQKKENNNNSTNNTNINYNKYNRNQNNEERNKNNRFRDVSPLPNTKLRLNTDRKNVETNYIRIKYNILLNNYEKLQEQIDILKNKNPYQKEIEKLINELNEKDAKLKKLIKDNSHNYNYNNNEDCVLKLEKENKELKEKISKLENSICRNPRDSLNIKLSNIKDFSSEKNKVEEAIIKLKEKLNDDLKKSINDILSFKEREIEIYKENQERLNIYDTFASGNYISDEEKSGRNNNNDNLDNIIKKNFQTRGRTIKEKVIKEIKNITLQPGQTIKPKTVTKRKLKPSTTIVKNEDGIYKL